jgi:hypothetical protein
MTSEQQRAYNAVRAARRAGDLAVSAPCEICDVPGEAHHEDYSRPLDVRWLCRMHHMWLHRYGETALRVGPAVTGDGA